MAITKYPMIRYQTLNKCFRNKYRKYYINDLIAACSDAIYNYCGEEKGCSRRTILEDIKFMESDAGWSIELEDGRDGHKRYYRYVDTNFTINETVLSESETDKLNEVILMLERFKGLPCFEWVDDILMKLQSGFRKSAVAIMEFDQASSLKGMEHFDKLFNSILYKQALDIKYKKFGKAEVVWTIHPYLIKQYNQRWFLFGKNSSRGGLISNLPLDRIESISDSNMPYEENDGSLIPMLEKVVGVTVDLSKEAVDVNLKFSLKRLPYVLTKPIHHSQQIVDQENGIIKITVIPNKELEAIILNYGPDVEVLSPLELREQIKEKIDLMSKLY